MKHAYRAFALALGLAATAALAHSGVQNPAVKARMDAMSAIADNTKTLGEMAKGARPFDVAAARDAAAAIAEHAARVPELFKAEADDPKSEAKDAIWTEFTEFESKSNALVEVAANAADTIASLDTLRTAMSELGGACRDCHKAFRE